MVAVCSTKMIIDHYIHTPSTLDSYTNHPTAGSSNLSTSNLCPSDPTSVPNNSDERTHEEDTKTKMRIDSIFQHLLHSDCILPGIYK